MNTILILDKDAKTGLSEDFKERILRILKEKTHRVEVVELGRNEVTPDNDAICEAFKKYV